MKTLSQKLQLETKIANLKNKQNLDFIILKNQYNSTINSFKPINLIKNSLEDIITTPSIKANVLNGALQLGTIFFSNNFIKLNSVITRVSLLKKVIKVAIKKIF
jgi:hypothetical protein